MAIAQIKNTSHTDKVPKTPDLTNHETDAESHVTTPQLRQEYRLAQQASKFFVLPDDLTPLMLTQFGKDVFKFGLTCKYWNLRTREFLTELPQGQKILREKYEKEFRSQHRMSVVDAFRALNSTSCQKYFDFDGAPSGKACAEELRTSKEPVCLVPPTEGNWMTATLKSALAARGCRLTIIEIDAPDSASMHSLIEAIKAIPSNGFITLCFSSATLSSPNAAELWGAIASHPVVAHIKCLGNRDLATGDQVVALMTQLSEKNARVSTYSLIHCRLDEQRPEALSALLEGRTGIDELEIFELEISAENVVNLFSAVRARNTSADSKMKLHFAAGNMQDLIDPRERSALVMDGIYIREPGQLWVIQEDPVAIQEDQEDKVLARKYSSAPDVGDDDSSSVVGDYSSGDDNYGSEFDTSDEESTANKG